MKTKKATKIFGILSAVISAASLLLCFYCLAYIADIIKIIDRSYGIIDLTPFFAAFCAGISLVTGIISFILLKISKRNKTE